MKTLISVTLALLFITGDCISQESARYFLAANTDSSITAASKERTSGLSFGAGYVIPYTKNSRHGTGLDLFLNYTGNTSQSVAIRGGLGIQFAATDDEDDLENFEGDQILLYAKLGTLMGQVGRNNPVNYYGFGEIRAGLGMVDLVSAIAADIDGKEKEAYFDLGFNLGGGISVKMSGNTRFFAEPVVSFATKYNSFVLRGGIEF